MNPFEMVIAIVLITTIAGVLKAKYKSHRHQDAVDYRAGNAENARLKDEVTALKERIQVLERITVEKENSLDREIERLRDR